MFVYGYGFEFDTLKEYPAFLLISLFGLPMLAALTFWRILQKISTKFQLNFFFRFYVLRQFRKLTGEELYHQNNLCVDRFNTKSIGDRMFRLATRLVNKANNYTLFEDLTKEKS